MANNMTKNLGKLYQYTNAERSIVVPYANITGKLDIMKDDKALSICSSKLREKAKLVEEKRPEYVNQKNCMKDFNYFRIVVTEAPVTRPVKRRVTQRNALPYRNTRQLVQPPLKKAALCHTPLGRISTPSLPLTPSQGIPMNTSSIDVSLFPTPPLSAPLSTSELPSFPPLIESNGLITKTCTKPMKDIHSTFLDDKSQNSPAPKPKKTQDFESPKLCKSQDSESPHLLPAPLDLKVQIRAQYENLKTQVYALKKARYESMTKELVALRAKILETKDKALQAVFIEKDRVYQQMYTDLKKLQQDIISLKNKL